MANHKSAIKRIRVNERRRLRNRPVISRVRTEVRKAREATALSTTAAATANADDAREVVMQAIRTLDKAAEKGILHKNNAARRKSRLMKRLAALDAAKGS